MGTILPVRTVSIAKHTVLYVPLFGFVYWFVGNILINRNNHGKSIEAMADAAKQVGQGMGAEDIAQIYFNSRS